MHVLILNQTFHPDTAATAQLMWDLARHLDASGHRVTAITSRHHYGTDRRHECPRQTIGNIEIRRVRTTGLGKGSLLRRMGDFASFYLSAAIEMQRIEAPDLILALTSPPMISALAAIHRKLRVTRAGRPVRFVYHVMDLYPDALTAAGVAWAASDLGWVTARTLEAADAVIVLGRDMRQRLLERYGDAGLAGRVHVIPPWSDALEITPCDKRASALTRSLGLIESFNIVYSGNLGVAHDISTLWSAMALMRNDAGAVWLFVGGGGRFEELRRRVGEAGWSHVRFLPYQPREQLGESLSIADVHLVTQLPSFEGIVVPSKLFGIMAAARPTVMVGPAGAECARIIAEHGAGYVVANGDAAGLVDRLRSLRDDPEMRTRMGHSARNALLARYDRVIACARIEMLLKSVVAGSSPPP
jgi:glycosyltransferase involved in cell wall biosynthesis